MILRLLTFIVFTSGCGCTNLSYPKYDKLVDNLLKVDMIMVEENSVYNEFRDSLSIDQLVNFTEHRSPIIRSYAFSALTQRKYPKLEEILQSHLQDTARVDHHMAHAYIYHTRVANFMVSVVRDFKYGLSEKQLTEYERVVAKHEIEGFDQFNRKSP